MGELALIDSGLSTAESFFKPVKADNIQFLVDQYKVYKKRIEHVANVMNGEDCALTIGYFIGGNINADDVYRVNTERLFDKEGAIKNLDADFWQRALQLTDVYEFMPAKRRTEWYENIREMNTPEFEENTVYATISDLLNNRTRFLSERVEGIFNALSGTHVTNRPEGFTKRMIINYAFDNDQWAMPNHDRAGYLSDLRYVISKFIGRESFEGWSRSYDLMKACRNRTGIWHEVDGDTMRIKTFKKGTMHIEIDEDIALQLNEVLHYLNPRAIPAKFRTRDEGKSEKTKVVKKYENVNNFLSSSVVQFLAESCRVNNRKLKLKYVNSKGKHFRALIHDILYGIGGKKEDNDTFIFDYDYTEVLDEILISGMIPDKVSHQFYPTPPKIAEAAVLMADISPKHICLEPSAGQGGLVKFMPKDTYCVELSSVNAKVLESKGYKVECCDFLEWEKFDKFDRIVMNPPFSEGRAKLHVEKALDLMDDNGKLVAILPSSFKNKFDIDGYDVLWCTEFNNEFKNTSVSVVLCVITKK